MVERFAGQNNWNVYFYQLKQKGSFKFLLPKENWWESIDIPRLQRNAPNDVNDDRPVKWYKEDTHAVEEEEDDDDNDGEEEEEEEEEEEDEEAAALLATLRSAMIAAEPYWKRS